MEVAAKRWHSSEKPKKETKSNENIKFPQQLSWSEKKSEYKTKEREISQPVRIKQLIDSKEILQNGRKKAQPERLAIFSEKKVGSTQRDNVGGQSHLKKSIKTHPCNKNTSSHSMSTIPKVKLELFHSNERERKVRRNLNIYFKSPKQRVQQITGTMCPKIQEKKKSISSNSNANYNAKSFLLPRKSIKCTYLRQRCNKAMPSTISTKYNDTIKDLNALEISENLHVNDWNMENYAAAENMLCESEANVDSNLRKSLLYNCEWTSDALQNESTDNEMSRRAKENVIWKDSKMQEQKYYNVHLSNSSVSTNADNLKDICNELKNVILTERLNMPMDGNAGNFFGKDNICIDKNTIVSLQQYLEDLLNVFQDNAFKVDLLLTHVKKILHVPTDSSSVSTNQYLKEENSEKKEIAKSIEDNNDKRKEASVKSINEEKENETPKKFEGVGSTDRINSLELSPKVLPITIPNYVKREKSALQDYINLKSFTNFLETPCTKRLKSHQQKSKSVSSNTPKNKSYLCNKILTELQNLHDE